MQGLTKARRMRPRALKMAAASGTRHAGRRGFPTLPKCPPTPTPSTPQPTPTASFISSSSPFCCCAPRLPPATVTPATLASTRRISPSIFAFVALRCAKRC